LADSGTAKTAVSEEYFVGEKPGTADKNKYCKYMKGRSLATLLIMSPSRPNTD